jgi:ribose transport system substrate-binding protein
MRKFIYILMVLVFFFSCMGAFGAVKRIAILTPYLASVTTNEMIQSIKKYAKQQGWKVTVIDTKGDFNVLANRFEDVIATKVDAIVMGMGDPNQLKTQIAKAERAGIPVFGGDAGYIPAMVLNVTSNNYVLSSQITSYLFDKMDHNGKIVKFYHSAHPGVRKREVIFDAMLEHNKGIELVADHFVKVPGPIEDARKAMESILLANPRSGSITAVWAAWDEPAIGAAQAIKAARREKEIIVTGIDGNTQALSMIKKEGTIVGTVKQDFDGIARILVEQIKLYFNGKRDFDHIIYAPSYLVTPSNVDDFIE